MSLFRLRLGYDKAGQVRFSQAGRPVIRVAKEIADNVKLVRDNFTANLLNYAGSVMRDNADGYKAQIETAKKAGEPIYQHDKNQLSNALKARAEAEAKEQAEALAKEAETETETEAQSAKSKGKRDLVHA